MVYYRKFFTVVCYYIPDRFKIGGYDTRMIF